LPPYLPREVITRPEAREELGGRWVITQPEAAKSWGYKLTYFLKKPSNFGQG
jgi:hypothetical protein